MLICSGCQVREYHGVILDLALVMPYAASFSMLRTEGKKLFGSCQPVAAWQFAMLEKLSSAGDTIKKDSSCRKVGTGEASEVIVEQSMSRSDCVVMEKLPILTSFDLVSSLHLCLQRLPCRYRLDWCT